MSKFEELLSRQTVTMVEMKSGEIVTVTLPALTEVTAKLLNTDFNPNDRWIFSIRLTFALIYLAIAMMQSGDVQTTLMLTALESLENMDLIKIESNQ